MSSARQRRIAYAVLAVSLGLTALFLAQGTTGFLATALLDIDPSFDEPGASRRAQAATTDRQRDATHILTRNIFDSETGSLLGGDEPEAEPAEPEEVVEDDGSAPPDCEGAMRLIGAVQITNAPASSFASIAGASGTALLYRPGADVDGNQLVSVESQRVLMRPSGGRLCKLVMFSEREESASPTPARRDPVTVRPEPTRQAEREGGIAQNELEEGIARVSDTEFNIQRGLVNKILENQAELMRTARIIPHEQNGRVVGVKLYGIRRNSLLGRLGLQNGDMLRTINGFDMTSPDSALEAYARLRNAEHLSVSVVRRGQPQTIDYNVR